MDLEDIESEISNWNTAVVCYVTSHRPFIVINGYIQRIGAKYSLNKASVSKNGAIVVQFDSVEGTEEVLKRGIYHFDNKLFIIKASTLDMEFTREELNSVPIWIKLPGLRLQVLEFYRLKQIREFNWEKL